MNDCFVEARFVVRTHPSGYYRLVVSLGTRLAEEIGGLERDGTPVLLFIPGEDGMNEETTKAFMEFFLSRRRNKEYLADLKALKEGLDEILDNNKVEVTQNGNKNRRSASNPT
jgi:hypothetical protein